MQSSSMPLQLSAWGVPGVHAWGWPLLQLGCVTRQAPVPQVVGARFSSIMPLQFSSTPLHTSGAPGEQPSVAEKVRLPLQVLGGGCGRALHWPGTHMKVTVPLTVVPEVNMPVTVQCGQ